MPKIVIDPYERKFVGGAVTLATGGGPASISPKAMLIGGPGADPVGPALGGLGDTMAATGAAVERHAAALREEHDRTVVKEQLLALDAATTAAMLSTDETAPGYLTLQGRAALDAHDGVAQSLSERRKALSDALSQGRQRQLFDELSAGDLSKTKTGMAQHRAKQSVVYQNDVSKATIDAARDEAVTHGADEVRVRDALYRAVAERQTMARRAGEDPVATREAAFGYVSGIRRDIAKAMATTDPLGAAKYLDAWRHDLTGADASALEAHIQVPLHRAKVAELTAGIVATGAADTPAGWLTRAETIADPQIREDVKSHLFTEWHRAETVRNAAIRANTETAWKSLMTAPNPTLDSVPPDVWSGLPPDKQQAMRAWIEHKAAGKPVQPTAENQATYYELMRQSAAAPMEFAELDLNPHSMTLPHGQWQQLVNLQTSIDKKEAAAKARTTDALRAMSVMKVEMLAAGIKTSPEPGTDGAVTLERLQGQLVAELDAFRVEKKRPATDSEILDIGRRLLVRGAVPGDVWGKHWPTSKRVFETKAEGDEGFYVPFDLIPEDRREQIAEAFRARNGREPTDQEITQRHASWLMGKKVVGR